MFIYKQLEGLEIDGRVVSFGITAAAQHEAHSPTIKESFKFHCSHVII
jgi:hypothetical protein